MLRELAVVRMVVEACAAPERVRRSLTLALGDVEAAWVQLRMERDALRARVEEAEAIALREAGRSSEAEREFQRVVADRNAVWEKRDAEFDRAEMAERKVSDLRAQLKAAEKRADDAVAALSERVGA